MPISTPTSSTAAHDPMVAMASLIEATLPGQAITAEHVPALMQAAWEQGETALNDMVTYLYRQFGDIKRAAQNELGTLALFFVDSEVAMLRNRAETARRIQDGDDQKDSIMVRMDGDLAGLELKHTSRDQYLVFLPDASKPGHFRMSQFDANGFQGHQTRPTYQQLLDEAFTDGFRIEVSGSLDRLSATVDFQVGNESAGLVAQLNSGHITFDEFATAQDRLSEKREALKATALSGSMTGHRKAA